MSEQKLHAKGLHDEKLEPLYQMLLDCYGIWSWEYDKNLELSYTNSPSEYFHGLLLLGRNRKQVIFEQGNTSSLPFIISNSIGTMWAVVKKKGKDGTVERYFAIGPIFTGELSKLSFEQLIEPLKLSSKNRLAIIDCMKGIPYVATTVFFQHTIILHYYVTGEKVQISDFSYNVPRHEEMVHPLSKEEERHAPFFVEKKLLDMVRTGNLNYHSILAEAGAVSPGIRARSNNPVRQAKYSIVAFITLCTRAAIEGGLSSECAYSLSDTYTEAVDNASTISQIAAVSHAMYDDFIRRVNAVRGENGISRSVRLCRDLIDNHADEKLELKNLAERVGYTEYYLARKFKAEIGVSVNTYIRRARIQQAKLLLSGTQLTVEEISAKFHFCSRSYFSAAFRESEGMTPSEYREKYKE